MAELAESQWELGGIIFGADCPVDVADFDPGAAEQQLGDVRLPGQDGIVFGRDTRSGPLMVWEMFTTDTDPAAGRAAWRALAAVWDAPAVRAAPRAVMPLRMRLPGGPTVVVYGRPRRLEVAESNLLRVGRLQLVADFQCADSTYYSDADGGGAGGEHTITLTLVASGGAGVTWPVTWPIAWAPAGQRQDAVVNAGDTPSWPVITIRGPVAQPSLELVGTGLSLRLDTTVAYDQAVVIDTRPWSRSVLRSDGASMAGVLRGASLSAFALPPGQTVLAYRGTDLSGQSTCTVAWRDAYSTP
jgi:hypothetical protein